MAGSTTSIPAAKKTMDMMTPKVIQVTAIQVIIPTAATQSVILIRREVTATAKGSVDTVDIVYVVDTVTVNMVDMVDTATVNAVDMVDTATVNAVDMVDMVTVNMVDMVDMATVNAVDMVDTVKVGNDKRKVIQAHSEMDYGQGHAVL